LKSGSPTIKSTVSGNSRDVSAKLQIIFKLAFGAVNWPTMPLLLPSRFRGAAKFLLGSGDQDKTFDIDAL